MIDITLQNFETELINGSRQTPVLLDIWAPWCAPCRTLGPLLEKLEIAYAGRFRLAKVNSDDQPEISGQLSQMFGVRSIPFCVLFMDGQPVDGFVGALPEAQIRAFLDKHVPSEAVLEAEEEVAAAEELMDEGLTDAALAKLQAALEADPKNETARIDLIKACIELGDVPSAAAVFSEVASQYGLSSRLQAAGHWIEAQQRAAASSGMETLDAAIAADRRNFEARYAKATLLWVTGHPTAAMDELLEIILRDKAWNQEAARKTYVAILEWISKPPTKTADSGKDAKGTLEIAGKTVVTSTDPVVDQYRRKLSMALF